MEMRQDRVVMQQWDFSCGAAALATVLSFGLGDPVSESRVLDGLARLSDPAVVRRAGGFSMLDLKRFAEARGFRGVGYGALGLDDLARFHWPIVPLRQAGGSAHFVVVVAVDADGVDVADPAFGRYRMATTKFAERWREGRALVISKL
jgi:predicted double-glycine peptidase